MSWHWVWDFVPTEGAEGPPPTLPLPLSVDLSTRKMRQFTAAGFLGMTGLIMAAVIGKDNGRTTATTAEPQHGFCAAPTTGFVIIITPTATTTFTTILITTTTPPPAAAPAAAAAATAPAATTTTTTTTTGSC